MAAALFRHHPLVGTIVEIRVEVPDEGAATEAHRLERIGGRRYSHVLDPGTGQPVDDVAAVAVISGSAASADATATMLGVLDTGAPWPKPTVAASPCSASPSTVPSRRARPGGGPRPARRPLARPGADGTSLAVEPRDGTCGTNVRVLSR